MHQIAGEVTAQRTDRMVKVSSILTYLLKINNMKKIIIALLVMFALQSCGTWKWVEPLPPNAANNHRFNK